MDIKENVVERTPAPVICGLPPQDYNEKGELKIVRIRMVKKLLKYEFHAIFPRVFILLGVLAGLTVLMNMVYLVGSGVERTDLELPRLFTSIFYLYSVVATPIVTIGSLIGRYNKNFFKSEGYLTFSIPASMEEHVLAKHLSSVLATLIAIVGSAISVFITMLLLSEGETDGTIIETVVRSPLSIAFEIFEMIILYSEALIGIFCVSGALACWGQKFEKKTKIIILAVVAYLIFMTLETLFWFLVEQGAIRFFFTDLGGHVGRWLIIFLFAGVIVFSVWYELRTLKKKLNLK